MAASRTVSTKRKTLTAFFLTANSPPNMCNLDVPTQGGREKSRRGRERLERPTNHRIPARQRLWGGRRRFGKAFLAGRGRKSADPRSKTALRGSPAAGKVHSVRQQRPRREFLGQNAVKMPKTAVISLFFVNGRNEGLRARRDGNRVCSKGIRVDKWDEGRGANNSITRTFFAALQTRRGVRANSSRLLPPENLIPYRLPLHQTRFSAAAAATATPRKPSYPAIVRCSGSQELPK